MRPGDYGIFIALGFVPFMASIAAQNSRPERRAAGYAGLAFLVMYAVIIALVYYAQLTSVRMDGALGEETPSIINYGRAGSLFFNYDLLGYGFMALCTFFFAFTVEPKDNGDKVFRGLLWGHGAFFLPCLVMLMFRCLPPI